MNIQTDRQLPERQQQFWLADRVAESRISYLVPMALELVGRLNLVALRQALISAIGRSDVLRTCVVVRDGTPEGELLPAEHLTFLVEPGIVDTERLAQLRDAEATTPIDLACDLPLRTRLARTADDTHILFITAHHIAFDYRSQQLLYDDIATAYNHHVRGDGILERRRPQYRDIDADRESNLQDQLAYWKLVLDDLTPFELPPDFARPPVRSGRGAVARRVVQAATVNRLRQLAAREGVSAATAFFAAAQVVMRRFSGRDDVTVGTTVSLRTQARSDEVIGPLINVVVLRCDLSGNPTFSALMERTGDVALDAYDQADVPFEAVVAGVRVARDASRTPLIQVLIGFGTGAIRPPNLVGLRVAPTDTAFLGSKYDLSLWYQDEVDGSVTAMLYYDTSLYAQSTVQRLADALMMVLEICSKDPTVLILDIPISAMGDEASDFASRGTEVAYRHPGCFHEAFREQAARLPAGIAVIDADGIEITYRELDERSDSLGARLGSLGIGLGSVVAVLIDGSVEALLAFIAVMKVGAAYLPLDLTHPASRLAFMLNDANVAMTLVATWSAHLVPESYAGEVVDVSTTWSEETRSPKLSSLAYAADNLAYVIYTSGSTGTPKGVMITHAGLMNYLSWAATTYFQSSAVGSLLVGSVAYDMAVPSLFLPLINGAAVRIPPRPASFAAVAEVLQGHESIGILKCAPGYLDVLAGVLGEAGVVSVGTYVVGGDALRGDTVRRWRRSSPNARIVNEYGPTETVVGCAVYDVPYAADYAPDGAIPIGRAIANTQVYVLDNDLRPVVRGGVGELYIGGAGVARGYLNRPSLTAEKFLPDPYGRAGSRLYRTGDLGRMDMNGNLLCLGRIDRQVKIRGYRVEVDEVESALSTSLEVGECVVVMRRTDDGENYLVAYVTPASSNVSPTVQDILAVARRRLPKYAVPTRMVVLAELPHMPNGKVDHAALPQVKMTDLTDQQPWASDAESAVHNAWVAVLGSQDFGTHDQFFDVGGSSLQLMRVINRLAELYDVELPMGTFFERPTIAEMSDELLRACTDDVINVSLAETRYDA